MDVGGYQIVIYILPILATRLCVSSADENRMTINLLVI